MLECCLCKSEQAVLACLNCALPNFKVDGMPESHHVDDKGAISAVFTGEGRKRGVVLESYCAACHEKQSGGAKHKTVMLKDSESQKNLVKASGKAAEYARVARTRLIETQNMLKAMTERKRLEDRLIKEMLHKALTDVKTKARQLFSQHDGFWQERIDAVKHWQADTQQVFKRREEVAQEAVAYAKELHFAEDEVEATVEDFLVKLTSEECCRWPELDKVSVSAFGVDTSALEACVDALHVAPLETSPAGTADAAMEDATDNREIEQSSFKTGEDVVMFAVSGLESTGCLWLQQDATAQVMDALHRLNLHASVRYMREGAGEGWKPTVGRMCLARGLNGDIRWYRVWVESLQDAKVNVRYVDFGARGAVSVRDTMPYDPASTPLPPQAHYCRLVKKGEIVSHDIRYKVWDTIRGQAVKCRIEEEEETDQPYPQWTVKAYSAGDAEIDVSAMIENAVANHSGRDTSMFTDVRLKTNKELEVIYADEGKKARTSSSEANSSEGGSHAKDSASEGTTSGVSSSHSAGDR